MRQYIVFGLGLALIMLPLIESFRAEEDAGKRSVGTAAATSGSPSLLDVSRLSPVILTASVRIAGVDPVLEVSTAVAAAAGLPSAAHLRLSKQEADNLGLTNYRFDQVVSYDGGAARVYGGDVIGHVRAGYLVSISGNVALGVNAVLPPTVNPGTARKNQLTHVRRRSPNFQGAGLPSSELLVIPGTTNDVVAWCSKADLTSDLDSSGNPAPAVLRICSAAHGAGEVIETRNVLNTVLGTGRSFYSGTVMLDTTLVPGRTRQYQMQAASAGNGATYSLQGRSSLTGGNGVIFSDADNTWGSGTLSDPTTVGVDAHFGAMMTYEYYLKVHGRNGIRNDGVGATSRVHFGGKHYNNAFWWDGCFCMTYGDGDGKMRFRPLVSLDVAGHEMSHGVTSATANLNYEGESGGLNEATSDIFGTMVEWYANSPHDPPDYMIGEMIVISGGALRWMYDPIKDGRSPNCWSPTLGGLNVHLSSGVANHFFYLLAEGSNPANGQPNSPTCNDEVVVGIGRDKAGAIWYRALTTYMVSSTNYAGARTATIDAAKDLYGAVEVATVAAAWAAVGVN